MENLAYSCEWCGKYGHWKRCSGCKATFFCGTDCQAQAWPNHKKVCKAVRASVDASGKDKAALSAHGHYRRGCRHMSKGRFKKAATDYRNAILIDPNDAGFHNNLGVILCEMRDSDGAIASFKKAIELNPNRAAGHNNMGLALVRKGDLNGAIASYQQALSLEPNFADARRHLELILRALNK
tara:strand:- start:3666 stop:4211 length:546 start_codon:yes stop_codon:yes gene_type:complete